MIQFSRSYMVYIVSENELSLFNHISKELYSYVRYMLRQCCR